MFWLLLATGFTGALTFVYVGHLVKQWLWATPLIQAHFSPKGGCTDAIVRELAAAHREVLVLAYGFTSRPIAQALVDAKLRGAHVEVVLDHSNEIDAHSDIHFLIEQGIVPLIDSHHSIAHNKVMLIDDQTIVTGSFNFTQHAESSNAENLLVLKHYHDLAILYRHDFELHKAHARAAEIKVSPATAEEKLAKEREHQGWHAHGHVASDPPASVEGAVLGNLRKAAALGLSIKSADGAEEKHGHPHEKKGPPPARAA